MLTVTEGFATEEWQMHPVCEAPNCPFGSATHSAAANDTAAIETNTTTVRVLMASAPSASGSRAIAVAHRVGARPRGPGRAYSVAGLCSSREPGAAPPVHP